MTSSCECCEHWIFEPGDMVPYGDTYVQTPGGYYCEVDQECEEVEG